MHLFHLWLVLIVNAVYGCHPECTWACDSPMCPAVCHPVCQQPVCSVCVNTGGSQLCLNVSQCVVGCPGDMCESEVCPQCETVCPDLCRGTPNCTIMCQAPQCSWQCSKPLDCPYPQCMLQCEHPACEYTGNDGGTSETSMVISLFILVVYIIL